MIKRKIKQFLFKLSGKKRHLKVTVHCKNEWNGNNYGGFYVCPTFLNENSIIYSFGIGEDISFDRAIIDKYKCQVFGFDPTPKSINWVSCQPLPSKFNFFPFGISNKSGLVDFFLPKNPNHVSGSIMVQDNIDTRDKITVTMKSIEDIANEFKHSQIDVLKMDIEGSEYDVIDSIINCNIKISQILIEFHDRFFENGNHKSKQAIKLLNLHGYEIFAVSDSYEEVSFINKTLLD